MVAFNLSSSVSPYGGSSSGGGDSHGLVPFSSRHALQSGAPVLPACVLPHLRIPKMEHPLSGSDMGPDADLSGGHPHPHDLVMLTRKRKLLETAPAGPAEIGPPTNYVALVSPGLTSSEHPVRVSKLETQHQHPLPTPAENPLDEPSPLGLRLKKTPSLLDLISMKLTQGFDCDAGGNGADGSASGLSRNRLGRCLVPTGSAHDKLKASNFPASSLKIGSWERLSRYEGDLVAKCYYAKRKLVWEVLDTGLKSKIEIQWSDISAMRASCPDNLPGSLEIEVSRPPLFFREINPQPRKHTLWQATSDFTGGEATVCMKHELQFPEGILNRHYEKLVQCDPRLKQLVSGTLATRIASRFETPVDGLQNIKDSHIVAGHSSMNFSGRGQQQQQQHVPPLLMASERQMDRVLFNCSAPMFPQKAGYEMRAAEGNSSELSSPTSVMDGRDESGGSDTEDLHMKEELIGRSRDLKYDASSAGEAWHDRPAPMMSWSSGLVDMRCRERQMLDDLRFMLLGESSSDQQARLLAATVGSMSGVVTEESLHMPYPRSLAADNVGDHTHTHTQTSSSSSSQQCLFTSILSTYHQSDEELGTIVASAKDVSFAAANKHYEGTETGSFSCSSGKQGSSGDVLVHLPRVASLPQFFDSVSHHAPPVRRDHFFPSART